MIDRETALRERGLAYALLFNSLFVHGFGVGSQFPHTILVLFIFSASSYIAALVYMTTNTS